jgi:uncharacterized protein YkwD
MKVKNVKQYLPWQLLVAAAFLAAHYLWAPHPAQAETYSNFAARMNSSLPGGATLRPDLEAVLLKLANSYRAQHGKPLLQGSDLFVKAARAHAGDMMVNNFVGHRASTGHNFDSRIRAFVDDITRFPAMAENAARDSQKTAADGNKARRLFQQWVESSSHRRTLTSLNYAFVSTGVVQRGNSIWAVQIFWATPRKKGMFQ